MKIKGEGLFTATLEKRLGAINDRKAEIERVEQTAQAAEVAVSEANVENNKDFMSLDKRIERRAIAPAAPFERATLPGKAKQTVGDSEELLKPKLRIGTRLV